jgi:thiosulfate/3-mercaptopyruvate sulfurtransferase
MLDCHAPSALAMTEKRLDDLVSTQWLAEHLGEADLVVVDSSVFMPGSGRDGAAEFLDAHIPGARFLDIEEVRDKAHPAPHMLPSAEEFGEAMRELGIGRDDRIVVYDNSPLRTAARGWFMLRRFGADRVAILDGGFQKWLSENRPVESGEAKPRSARFDAVERADEVVAKKQLLAGVDTPLLDARGKARFEGSEADPRPGVGAGHIPGARNLPFAMLYKDDGRFKSPDEIRQLFDEARIDPEQPFIASCGSGVTANSLIFAAHLLGNHGTKLYDGSWSEWGSDPDTPKEQGPA